MRFKLRTIFVSILCSLFFVQTASAQFVDVVNQSLFYDAVMYFVYEEPILTLDRDRFKPLDKITKAEYFKLLFESSGYDPIVLENADIPFHDVVGDEWFANYVEKALETEIVEFDEFEPNFKPGETVNRCDAIDWVIKLYGIDPDVVENFPNEYSDISSFDPCSNISKIAFSLELLHDHKTREFNSTKELTRAEAIHIFYQIKNNDLSITLPVETKVGSIDPQAADSTFSLFFQVWNKISDDYIEDYSEEELVYGAIAGLVNKLDDPYSIFFEPIDATDYLDALEGSFDGIGIYINQEDGKFVILTPLKGSPAEAADIKPGDIIVEVDDQVVQGIMMDELIELLRGVSGTEVKLKILRASNFYIKKVIRSHIEVPYVESEMQGDIGIIYYNQFTSNSNQQLIIELETLSAQNPNGIIIDLRNNPGGYIYSAQQLISRFIPKGESYIQIMLSNGITYEEASLGPGDFHNIPMIVLLNEGSASASEIAALALKEQNNAKIVGATSFGKGKIQEIITFNDGSSLKLSIAKWSSPNGIFIGGIGIEPDYNVQPSDTDDTQLKRAIELLN